jgi:hypothetical protein
MIYFPSRQEVVFISDPAQFPDLQGIPLENMWGQMWIWQLTSIARAGAQTARMKPF